MKVIVLCCLAIPAIPCAIDPLAREPGSTPHSTGQDNEWYCLCPQDLQIEPFAECPCEMIVNVTAVGIQEGACNAPNCLMDVCKWAWSIEGWVDPACNPQFFVNGGSHSPPNGWHLEPDGSFSSGANTFRLGCESTGSVALGFDDVPCIEINFQCDDCAH